MSPTDTFALDDNLGHDHLLEWLDHYGCNGEMPVWVRYDKKNNVVHVSVMAIK